jgi:hypothetical protein
MEEGGVLNKETQDKLDQDFQTVLGENYDQFQAEMDAINNQFTQELENLLNNDFLNIHCPLESTDFNTLNLELIDIITNLISHFYL